MSCYGAINRETIRNKCFTRTKYDDMTAIIKNQKDKKRVELEPRIINWGHRFDPLAKIYIT